ncbi:polysaccharide deacetylase family protein [Burkholderia ubonensis]|uniref:polysaccharide deacetylase family protein n=1 Tax=Burkholderia ubonensis TaxID=101571 RepID=UPI0009B43FFC|nr:polysaccharide deacetylase family protein [Burkholderia ubonensis]
MIGVVFSHTSADAGSHVLAAIRRSVSTVQAAQLSRASLRSAAVNIVVAVDVPDPWGADLVDWLRAAPRKLVLFGRLPSALAELLGFLPDEWPVDFSVPSRSAVAPAGESRESSASVQYTSLADTLGGRCWSRPFERFDFADEWNNLGYGRIRHDGSIWSVAQAGHVPEHAELARVQCEGERCFSYAALWDDAARSVLWFNRAVGPCDSFEWRVVENYLSGHRSTSLPCQPIISEIPWGYDAAITSRLDCDEEVESARPLWEAYQRMGVPFSLAVHTQNLHRADQHRILWELLVDQGQGAVLSHTATHAPNWGGSYAAALDEATRSAQTLQIVTGNPVRFAVSPFHQTPPYALQALSDAGYEGCIGGIIRNDPEFVLARGGVLAGMPADFVGHSQQCMLHGDCMLNAGDPLAVYRQAFDLAYDTRTLFGYLDHPFSPRYQYGWRDEASRIAAHEQLIGHIRRRAPNPLFLTAAGALEFLARKSMTQIVCDGDVFRIRAPESTRSPYVPTIEFRGVRTIADPREALI